MSGISRLDRRQVERTVTHKPLGKLNGSTGDGGSSTEGDDRGTELHGRLERGGEGCGTGESVREQVRVGCSPLVGYPALICSTNELS